MVGGDTFLRMDTTERQQWNERILEGSQEASSRANQRSH